jgi:hypothetical protein
MANQQQVLFAETIAGMKKALKRRAYGTHNLVNGVRLAFLRQTQLTLFS